MDARPDDLPPITLGQGVLIVLNAQSGAAVLRADPRPVFAERLPHAIVHELSESEDLAAAVAERMAGDDTPSVLGVYGGDGSVARMAGIARRCHVPLLVIPGGTFNHFARSLGIDDVDTAIAALEAGTGRSVTVLEVAADEADLVTVLNAVSVGTYPAFLEKRENRHERFGKWLGGLFAAVRELHEAAPIGITRRGERASVWSVFVSVGRNDPELVATMQRDTPDDGLLDVRIHHARGSRLRAVASSLTFGPRTFAVLRAMQLMPSESDIERLVLPEITITVRPRAGRPSVFVHDGELEERDPAGFTLRCVAVPAALRVYAPAPSSQLPRG